jgi:hypothetical protein
MSKNFKPLDKAWLVALMAASLTACGGGDGDNNPPPSGSQPPPAQPAPPPPPPPPPPASPGVPTLSSTVTDITDDRRIGTVHWPNGNTAQGAGDTELNGMPCTFNLPQDYHVHAYVGVYLNGELLALPQNIGIVPKDPARCFYPIHTHDTSGKIHVEWSDQGDFTLGDLFDIWGQPLSSTDVAGLTGMPIQLYVVEDGTVTEVEDTWDDIELTSKKMIHIVVGTPPAELVNITYSEN